MIDFSIIIVFFSQQPYDVVSQVFALGGWVVLVGLFLYAALYTLYLYKLKRWSSNWNWVLLAIDVPQENIQTPKAVEQLFSHIFSVMEPPTIGLMYRRGFRQYKFSFEIISIEGYIQFLIRTLDKFRDVVEAAVYAQYPEAEITEVEDYTTDIPSKYPNDTHDIWAADFILTEHYSHPIRLYKEFEHTISKDTVFKDPMGAFLESFSRIGPGEQMWYQILIEPIEEKRWKEECIKKIKELAGEEASSGSSALSKQAQKSWEEINFQLLGTPRSEEKELGKEQPPTKVLYLTPGQKKLLEAMEDKISKIGYRTKIRAIYVARKEVFNPARGVNSLVGAINQFNIPSSNSLLPKYITRAEYFFAERRKLYRKNLLMNAYKKRSLYRGKRPYILNIEELATIWHFPMSYVKTPLVQKAEGKKSEPPSGLPIEQISTPIFEAVEEKSKKEKKAKGYVTDAGDVNYPEGQKFG